MDFEKIRPAVEDFSLSDSQKEEILNACRGKKRKFNYRPLAAVAAAVIIVVIAVSPGFLFRAKSEDSAVQEAFGTNDAFDFYYNTADEEIIANSASGSQTFADDTVFDAEGFSDIYAVIPREFSALVNRSEYNEWKVTVTADGGMAIMQFAEHFGITREDFDAANNICGARTGSYFNSDIIYTFDKNAVDEFYGQ